MTADEAARVALDRIDRMLAKESDAISYAEIAEAVRCIVAFRNATIEALRAGSTTQARLDRANALVSLAHGAEYPLVDFHRDRIEQAKAEIAALL